MKNCIFTKLYGFIFGVTDENVSSDGETEKQCSEGLNCKCVLLWGFIPSCVLGKLCTGAPEEVIGSIDPKPEMVFVSFSDFISEHGN